MLWLQFSGVNLDHLIPEELGRVIGDNFNPINFVSRTRNALYDAN